MTTQSLRIVFAGTPDFAAKHLQALISAGHNVIAAYTQPDRPAGRGQKLQPSDVKITAQAANIPVFQPENFKQPDSIEQLQALQPDIMVVVAYGLLLPKSVLSIPALGCINVHGSILPKWRGAAPIQRSLLEGDAETGVTIMQMDEGLDTGDMLLIKRCAITGTDTSASLYDKLAEIGPVALIDCLTSISAGTVTAQKQKDELATYAKKLTKDEARINWSESADVVERKIRGYQPWPIAHCQINQQTVKIHGATFDLSITGRPGQVMAADKNGITVACGKGGITVTKLQAPGKKAVAAVDFLNGYADWVNPGSILQ